jgi:hypothetical protein
VASAARAGGAFTDSQNAARLTAQGGGGFTDSQNAARINVTVNGAIDPISTARQIAEVLNNEATLNGTFTNLGVSRLVAIQ